MLTAPRFSRPGAVSDHGHRHTSPAGWGVPRATPSHGEAAAVKGHPSSSPDSDHLASAEGPQQPEPRAAHHRTATEGSSSQLPVPSFLTSPGPHRADKTLGPRPCVGICFRETPRKPPCHASGPESQRRPSADQRPRRGVRRRDPKKRLSHASNRPGGSRGQNQGRHLLRRTGPAVVICEDGCSGSLRGRWVASPVLTGDPPTHRALGGGGTEAQSQRRRGPEFKELSFLQQKTQVGGWRVTPGKALGAVPGRPHLSPVGHKQGWGHDPVGPGQVNSVLRPEGTHP